MSHRTPVDLLVLHTVRTLGYADTERIALRLDQPPWTVADCLLDAQARGWVVHTSFGGDGGWSLTEVGRSTGERLVAAELDAVGARAAVALVHQDFLPSNDTVAAACTAWQLAELGLGSGPVTLAETVTALRRPAAELAGFERRLTAHLTRFAGYHRRFTAALSAAGGQPAWITGTDRDSCHRVWFELHEDLVATLGLTR